MIKIDLGGENMAARKILGHRGIGYFVGNIDGKTPYTPEQRAIRME